MKKIKLSILSSVFMLSLALSPVAVLAQDNNSGENEGGARIQQNVDANFNQGSHRGFFSRFFNFLDRYENNRGNGNGNNDNGNGNNQPPVINPTVNAPVISNLTVTSKRPRRANITWTTDIRANSKVWYSTTSPVVTTGTPNITRRGGIKNHVININGLTPSTTYYVIIGSANKIGTTMSSEVSFTTPATNIPNPTPDTNAPVISNIHSSAGATTSTITWTTNEPSNSTVYYSTVTPLDVNAGTTLSVADASLVTNHSVNITGLTTNTNYHFIVKSLDASSNATSSAESSFATFSDVTAPVISNIQTLNGSTTSTITWTTDEPSNSNVYYSTITPVDLGAVTTHLVTNTSLVTSHSIAITGLTSSTVYHFILKSADASNNIATSNESSLITN